MKTQWAVLTDASVKQHEPQEGGYQMDGKSEFGAEHPLFLKPLPV